MSCVLILSADLQAARERALSALGDAAGGDRAYIWVPPLEGEGQAARPNTENAPLLEGCETHLEALILGSRLAQQMSWVDAVIAEGLDHWALNLHRRYPGDHQKIDSERVSLLSVLDNAMADAVLISRPAESLAEPDAKDLLARTLEELKEKVDEVIEI